MAKIIYKICEVALWRQAERAGVFRGASVDIRDGFIHFSYASQVLFPHLYGELPLGAVLWVKPLPPGVDRQHVFPELPA